MGDTTLMIKKKQYTKMNLCTRETVIELKAILFGMKSLVRVRNTHVKILSDNTAPVHAIDRMGTSHSNICNQVATDI